jgi:hypothetical protein
VNKEARDAALGFYRVRVPCIFGGDDTRKWVDALYGRTQAPWEKGWDQVVGTLYLNPEYDFLLRLGRKEMHINQGRRLCGWTDVTIDFMQRFKTVYDPRRVGLLNLVVDMEAIMSFPNKGALEQSQLEPAAIRAFTDTFAQLREVFFLNVCFSGRSFGAMPLFQQNQSPFFSHSYPMMAPTPNFEGLARDPRAIDLVKVPVLRTSVGPEDFFPRWQGLMEAWGISQERTSTDFRIVLAADSRTFGEAHERRGALQCMREEKARFDRAVRSRRDVMEDAADPVVGFWIFPLSAFPAAAEGPSEPWMRLVATDLSGFWPELGVFDLK